MSLMQWAMTKDAPASSQVSEQEGGRNDGAGDEGAGDQCMAEYLWERVFPPLKWSPSLIRKRRGG